MQWPEVRYYGPGATLSTVCALSHCSPQPSYMHPLLSFYTWRNWGTGYWVTGPVPFKLWPGASTRISKARDWAAATPSTLKNMIYKRLFLNGEWAGNTLIKLHGLQLQNEAIYKKPKTSGWNLFQGEAMCRYKNWEAKTPQGCPCLFLTLCSL